MFTVPSAGRTLGGLAPNSAIVIAGDSINETAAQVSGIQRFANIRGALTWALAISGAPLRLPVGNMLAAGGSFMSTIASDANITAIIATGAKMLFINGSTNDLPTATSAKTINGLWTKVVRETRAADMVVIALTPGPRFAPNALTSDQEIKRQAVRAHIKSLADNDGVYVIDLDPLTTDWPSYLSDGLHLNDRGGLLVGQQFAPILAANCKKYDAIGLFRSTISANPEFKGTTWTGNKFVSGQTIGEVATSWNLDATSTTAIVNGIKYEDPATGAFYQRLEFSGQHSGNGGYFNFLQDTGTPGGIVAGDQFETLAVFDLLTPLVGISALQVYTTVSASDFSVLSIGSAMTPDNQTSDIGFMPPGRYVVRVPPQTVGFGTPAKLIVQYRALLKNQAAPSPVSGLVQLTWFGAGKATP